MSSVLLSLRSAARTRGFLHQSFMRPSLISNVTYYSQCKFSRPFSTQSNDDANLANASVSTISKKPNTKYGGGRLGLYAELSKLRLSSLVVFTSGAGFILAGAPYHWDTFFACVTGTSLAAAAANTFNQIYERKTDGLMRRTSDRPLPSGRMTVGEALRFGVATTTISTALLYTMTNPLTAALGFANIVLYAGVYTPLKQVSTWNTAVGAIVGAIPPLMGWAAATGSLASPAPFLLAYLLFAWQFPHFYALAYTLRKDYARGGYKMVPVVEDEEFNIRQSSALPFSNNDIKGDIDSVAASGSGRSNNNTFVDSMTQKLYKRGEYTAKLALSHMTLLSLLPPVCYLTGVTSHWFAITGVLASMPLLILAIRFHRSPTETTARKLFLSTLWYLPLLLLLMLLHAHSWGHDGRPIRSADEGVIGIDVSKMGETLESSSVQYSTEDRKLSGGMGETYSSSVSMCPHHRILTFAGSYKHASDVVSSLGKRLCIHEYIPPSMLDTLKAAVPSSTSTKMKEWLLSGSERDCHSDYKGKCPVSILKKDESGSLSSANSAGAFCPVVVIENKLNEGNLKS